MAELARDPIINAISNGIRRGIEVTIANGCHGSAVVLIYSGMDSMAFLAMPKEQTDVTGKDFIDWTDRYIKFPCKDQLTGADLYGARCAMVHTYSMYSRMSRDGKARITGRSKLIPMGCSSGARRNDGTLRLVSMHNASFCRVNRTRKQRRPACCLRAG